jgi:hypothetical protein
MNIPGGAEDPSAHVHHEALHEAPPMQVDHLGLQGKGHLAKAWFGAWEQRF